MPIDLRLLRYFLIVARHENISRAARELGITQPALSRQVRLFEQEMGWDLLERGGRSVRLTAAGKVVAEEGRKLWGEVHLSVRRMRREVEGREMRIGYAPSLVEGVLEGTMKCFVARYPGIRVSWFDDSTQEMWQGIREETRDVIIEVVSEVEGIEWAPVWERAFQVAVPEGHRLANRGAVRPEDLDGEHLVLLSRHEYPGYWERVTGWFKQEGINAKIAGEFDGIRSLSIGVQAGLGLALVAEGAPLSSGIRSLALIPRPEPLQIGLGWRKGRRLREWEQAFLESLRGE